MVRGQPPSMPPTQGVRPGGSGFGWKGGRNWIYAKRVAGRFQRLHRASGFVLLAILAVVPWLQVGGLPMLRIDVPARRLYLVGTVFTAADGFNLVLLGLLAAFSLFFFTSLFGSSCGVGGCVRRRSFSRSLYGVSS